MYIVLRAEIDKPAKKSVLIGLAEHAWPDGSNAFPGVERIAAYTSLGESTVREKLAELRSEGLISIAAKARHHRPTNYTINLPKLAEMEHSFFAKVAQRPPAPPIYGGIETSSSQRSDAETSGSRRPESAQTSSSQQTDLQQLDPNHHLTVDKNRGKDIYHLSQDKLDRAARVVGHFDWPSPAPADSYPLDDRSLLALAIDGLVRDQLGPTNSHRPGPAFQAIFRPLQIQERTESKIILKHPHPELIEPAHLRMLEREFVGILCGPIELELARSEK